MAISDLPIPRLRECTFTLQDGTVSSGWAKGKTTNVSQIVDPTWKLRAQTQPLDRRERQIWSAWKNSLKGGLNRLRTYDLSQSAPLAYQDVSSPAEISAGWDGTASVASVGLSGVLALTGVPVGYVASIGDRVGLEQGGYYGHYEIQSQVVANGSGQLTVTVSPLLHTTYFTSASVARLWRPTALFVIDWSSWDLSVTTEPTPATFEANQVLK